MPLNHLSGFSGLGGRLRDSLEDDRG